MPTKTYFLDEAQTDAVTVQWGMFYRNFNICRNGTELGRVSTAEELRQGQAFPLGDGRVFSAQLSRTHGTEELALLLDGQPVPGSGTHPLQRIKQAWYVLLFIGSARIVMGIVGEMMHSDTLRGLGMDWYTVGEGVVFIGLGWWGYRRHSAVAFYIALALFVLGTVLSFASGGAASYASLALRFFMGLGVFRGAKACQALKADPLTTMLTR